MNASPGSYRPINGREPFVQTDEQYEIAHVLVETLDLEVAPEEIDPHDPLFGDGLGLDSIDLLEIVLVVSKRYGVELTSEDRPAFASLRALTNHIMERRTR